jgi:hypothetical protein
MLILLPIFYLMNFLINKAYSKYIHYTVPILYVFIFLFYRNAFVLNDDGVKRDALLFFFLPILITFSLKYINNKLIYRILLVLDIAMCSILAIGAIAFVIQLLGNEI